MCEFQIVPIRAACFTYPVNPDFIAVIIFGEKQNYQTPRDTFFFSLFSVSL
jgi:hypothetical protein